jgi:hypothetical protein
VADLEKAKKEARERNNPKNIADVGSQEGQVVVNTGSGENRVPDTGPALAKAEARERSREADDLKAAAGAMAVEAQEAERDIAREMSATSDVYGTGRTHPQDRVEYVDEAREEARKEALGSKFAKVQSADERRAANKPALSDRTREEMDRGKKAVGRFGPRKKS